MGKKADEASDMLAVRGFFRLHVVDPDGTVVGDTGWCKNIVTNDGFNDYIIKALISSTGSKYCSYMALGSGTAPAATSTSLPGEHVNHNSNRTTMTMNTSNTSKVVQFLATWNSSWNTAQVTLSNLGIYASSATTASNLFAGNTYNAQTCATNQAVNVTYNISFNTV